MQAKRILQSKRFLGAAALFGVLATALAVGGRFAVNAEFDDPETVATVNGEPIPWAAVDPRGEWPETRSDEAMRRALAGEIGARLREQVIRDAGIEISDAEVEAEVDAYFAQDSNGQTLGEHFAVHLPDIQQKSAELTAALRAAFENSEESDAIYEERVAPLGVLDKASWDMLREFRDTEKKIAEMESQIPQDFDDIKANTRLSVRRDLLHNALQEHLAGDFTVSESDHEPDKRPGDDRPLSPGYVDDPQEEVRRAKRDALAREAWLEILDEAAIVVHEPALKPVVSDLERTLRTSGHLTTAPGAAMGMTR